MPLPTFITLFISHSLSLLQISLTLIFRFRYINISALIHHLLPLMKLSTLTSTKWSECFNFSHWNPTVHPSMGFVKALLKSYKVLCQGPLMDELWITMSSVFYLLELQGKSQKVQCVTHITPSTFCCLFFLRSLVTKIPSLR